MCGIAGIIGRVGPENRAALRRLTDAMTHRGPDGEGHWESPPDEGRFGLMLGHRRLSILDLSSNASQPMVDPESGDVVVLNGEIYNYVALRDALPVAHRSLASSGDTAAMLRTLSLHGAQGVERLRGMFSFAFWDIGSQQLTLARDPLGIKPLYFACNPDSNGSWALVFASEVRAILASGLLRAPKLNPSVAAAVVWNGFAVAPETAVQGVESLWPGEYLCFGADGKMINRRRYWTATRSGAIAPATDEDVATALEESVRLHLASDVPLGVFLSGGIDSSVVANIAHRTSSSTVHTFTLAFEERERNEGVFARQIAQAIGTTHHEVLLREVDFVDGLEDALRSLDQPSFDGLNSYFMSRAVREAGFKVALVGSGGDELFGGYTSFRELPKLSRWAPLLRLIPRQLVRTLVGARHAGGVIDANAFPPQTRWAKLPAMLEASSDLLTQYQLAYALFLPDTQRELLMPTARAAMSPDGLPSAMRESLRLESRGRATLPAISLFEQRMFLGERLLRDTDATSMASSIEIRLPLVDQVLLETVDRVPESTRYEPVRSKAMLRRLGLRGLDPRLFDRPKSGFELPYDRWLRSKLGNRIDETLADRGALEAAGLDPQTVRRLWSSYQRGAPGLYWTRIWSLFVLTDWAAHHRVSI